MKTPEHLQRHFDAGRRWLVVTGRQAFMASEDAVFYRVGGAGQSQFLCVDLADLWNRLPLLLQGQTEFSLSDLAKASGRSHGFVVDLHNAELIGGPDATGKRPKFRPVDVFGACLAGSLKRYGVPQEVMAKAVRFIVTGQGLEAAAR